VLDPGRAAVVCRYRFDGARVDAAPGGVRMESPPFIEENALCPLEQDRPGARQARGDSFC